MFRLQKSETERKFLNSPCELSLFTYFEVLRLKGFVIILDFFRLCCFCYFVTS